MRLKNAIRSQNTTQEWISGKINVPLSTFKKWMTRKTYPNLQEGVEIAKLLETSAEYLVTGIKPDGLSDEEHHLVTAYRKLCREDRENILLAIDAWLKKQTHSYSN